MSAELIRIPWKPIEPLPVEDRLSNGAFAALDALRDEWERRLAAMPEHERIRLRQQSLRRLSIETGILEHLYDIDWGLTQTLVAEGFTRDVVERADGRVDDGTLATLRAQEDSLAMVLDLVYSARPLSPFLIRELHASITRTQNTYEATDSLDRPVEIPFLKGTWKTQPNHVRRRDNTLLEYAPPEQVASEMDALIRYWSDLDRTDVHPIVKAAWLHHRFVQIHPFSDGNGRVARALTLPVLQKHHYAPLVIDRFHRNEYLDAIDAANDGSLGNLIALFVKLEGAALTRELERPIEAPTHGLAVDVAHTLAAQLAERRTRQATEIQRRLTTRALAVGGRLRQWFDRKRGELDKIFKDQSLTDIVVLTNTEMPPSEKTNWWRRQVIESAQMAGHYADLRRFAGWSVVRICTDRWQLRYVASLHGAGREPGVMAVTTFADITPSPAVESENEPAPREPMRTTVDAFRFVHTESLEQIDHRATELETLLDTGLTVALAELLKRL